MLYSRLPAFVLGFHGCDRATADHVISTATHLKPSANRYDWLGHGIYFWDNDPTRAMAWARQKARRVRVRGGQFVPAVIGAVIDLGNCLNLLDAASVAVVKRAYVFLKRMQASAGVPMPENQDLRNQPGLPLRRLDCAVINALHAMIAEQNEAPFDSVRAAFIEGDTIYPHAGFYNKNHVQICVRNRRSIKGYFHTLA